MTSTDNDNVIHVFFGPEGGHRISTPSLRKETPIPPPPEDTTTPQKSDDPLADLYSAKEVATLFGMKIGRLRYWSRIDFLAPSARRGRRRYYTFQDLIGLRAAKGLIDKGVPLKEVRKSVEALRHALPKVVRPLAELRVIAEGHAMLVRDDSRTFEARTGQMVIDFRVDSLRDDVVRVLRYEPTAEDRRGAYEAYLEGCRLDEDPASYDAAEAAYLEALRLDPGLAHALTNLGNLCYRRGDEESAFRRYTEALDLDPNQPEALYNLGFMALDHDEHQMAVQHFEQALRCDPAFADAHFNLALTYETLGDKAAAKPHWEIYLRLEPKGEWAEVARRHLGE